MAIVHIAVFDAINAMLGGYQSYTGVLAPHGATAFTGLSTKRKASPRADGSPITSSTTRSHRCPSKQAHFEQRLTAPAGIYSSAFVPTQLRYIANQTDCRDEP